MINEDRLELLKEFLNSINVQLENFSLIETALTHSSYTFENKHDYSYNNERLEFFGDSVLKLVASEYLYNRFPDYNEGDLTKIRAILVSDNVLANLANKISLAKYIKLGFHEEKMGGRNRLSTLACAFEAVLGALYIENKFIEAKNLLFNLMESEVTQLDNSVLKSNPKAILQEYTQGKNIGLPEYVTVKEEGPSHNKSFVVEVYIQGDFVAKGLGKTKKAAQQNAANDALLELGVIEEACL